MEAYRYLNTYHDGISDEDREWNKFEEKDYVELGTSGLMVSRVRWLVCNCLFVSALLLLFLAIAVDWWQPRRRSS